MNEISWDKLKESLKVGEQITGTVKRHEQYGVFVDIGYEFDGLIQITDFKDEGIMTQEEYPIIGSKIRAAVLGFKDHGCQIWLGVKPSQLKG
jgi:ribosomal protein S1